VRKEALSCNWMFEAVRVYMCGDCVCVSFVACGKTVAYECQVPNPISNVSMQQQSW
jgi:hypothetical protein